MRRGREGEEQRRRLEIVALREAAIERERARNDARRRLAEATQAQHPMGYSHVPMGESHGPMAIWVWACGATAWGIL